MLGTTEWIVVGVIVLLLFGAPKVISWARALGTAQKEYTNAKKGVEEELKQ